MNLPTNKKSYHLITVVALTVLVTYLHFTSAQLHSRRIVLDELYYLPLLIGVVRFRIIGAIGIWLLVSLSYLPFFFGAWAPSVPQVLDRTLHLVTTGVFTAVACFLAERERKNRKQSEQERYLAGLGQVAAVIVHDLKNPLVSIMGFSRRIREGKGNPAVYAETIENSARDMQNIVTSVLDFTKPLQLELTDSDVRENVQRCCDVCRTKADSKGVTLSLSLSPAPLMAAVDCFHLERALTNLIDNAVDASPCGTQVSIAAAIHKNKIEITIKDQGAGMSTETLTNLFMPFYTTKDEGTGLGMPISKKVIETHGGTLGIASKQGIGTTVTVILPHKKC